MTASRPRAGPLPEQEDINGHSFPGLTDDTGRRVAADCPQARAHTFTSSAAAAGGRGCRLRKDVAPAARGVRTTVRRHYGAMTPRR